MNTVSKGNAFEDKVFSYFKDELDGDKLFVPKKMSSIYQKKAYHSKMRNDDIITDISIETFMPGALNYSILTVIECKDYASAVSVNKLEDFDSKIQQIAGDSAKAIFATTASLQKSALAFAESRKIAVIRFIPDNQVDWVMYHMTPDMIKSIYKLNSYEFKNAFSKQNYRSENRDFYACYNGKFYGDIKSLMLRIVQDI